MNKEKLKQRRIDKEYARLAKAIPEGWRIRNINDPVLTNEIGVATGSEHEYMTMLILIVYVQHEYRAEKKKGKKPRLGILIEKARKHYQEIQDEMLPKDRSDIKW